MERTDFGQWNAKDVARLLALLETERRYYQEMVASLPVALIVLSADRSIVSANRAFRQTFGVKTEDLRGKSIEQIVPSEQLIEKIRDVRMNTAAQPSIVIEVNDRRMRAWIVPIRNWEDDSEIETLVMLEEVQAGAPPVARAAATAATQVSTAIPAIVWQADATTFGFTSVSGAAEQILGYPASHWLSTPQFFRERIHPEDRAETIAFYEAAVEREGDASAEFRAVAQSGKVVWCRETVRVAHNRLAGVLTDITARKQLEQQLLTVERTDALHGLASRLAHDLNNPLMIITGYAEEMVNALKPDDAMHGDIQQIMEATQRISGITGQLLEFTRKLANPAHPVNVSAVMAGLEDKIAAGESAKVEIDPGESVWAQADATQLEEAILALVSGAREDARERSRVSVSCRVDAVAEQIPHSTLAPGIYAAITIRDNGRGTDAKVFEAVLAKDPASAALARAYSMVREWGGDIAFASQSFRGSEFTIFLPWAEPEGAPVEAPVAQPTPPPEPVRVEPPRETILLVEDEAGIRALIRKILRRENYTVLEAGNAEEAINIVRGHEGRINLLLTDVMLPGMGGRDLAERLRASLPDLKVLYVSGFTSDEEVRAGAFPPGSKFLQKPFTLSSLVSKVREALGNTAETRR